MPKLNVRKPADVQVPIHINKAMLEQQKLYEGFVTRATGSVGELTLDAAESMRSVKVRLTRAATRLGRKLQVWDVGGKIYFQAEAPSGQRE